MRWPSSHPVSAHQATSGMALPLAAIAVTLVFWSSAFVAIRHLGHDFSPGALSLGRLLVGSLCLGVAVLAGRRLPRPTLREWAAIVVVGLLWFGVYNVALNAGELRVDAGTASMLLQVSPILIAVLAAVFLGERFTKWLAAGLLLAGSGVIVIGLSTSQSDSHDVWGVLLCLTSALSYSISLVLQKPLVRRLSALHITWLSCTVGMIACLPFGADLYQEASSASWGSIFWLVYLGVCPTAIAFTTYAYALKYLSAGSLGTSTYLTPPLAIVMGVLFLGEAPPAAAYLGGLLALVGVAVARVQSRPRASGAADAQVADPSRLTRSAS